MEHNNNDLIHTRVSSFYFFRDENVRFLDDSNSIIRFVIQRVFYLVYRNTSFRKFPASCIPTFFFLS